MLGEQTRGPRRESEVRSWRFELRSEIDTVNAHDWQRYREKLSKIVAHLRKEVR